MVPIQQTPAPDLGRTIMGVALTVAATVLLGVIVIWSKFLVASSGTRAETAEMLGVGLGMGLLMFVILLPTTLLLCVPAYQAAYRALRERSVGVRPAFALAAVLTAPLGGLSAGVTAMVYSGSGGWAVPLALFVIGTGAGVIVGAPLAWRFGFERDAA